MLQGCFVGNIEDVGSLRHVEMRGSMDFWVNIVKILTFWCFSMKPADTGHVLKADTMVVGASDNSMSSTLGTTESDGF